jgi:DNA mismatch repair protein MutS
MKKTPMMEQYLGFKRQYPDKIVLFRMGDFYETFGEDAKLASKVLNITLTSRDKDKDPTPLAGFPYHALDQYLPKIIRAGECAVVVEQVEDPKMAQGVVKRAVTRVVTPGTLDGDLADDRKNSYLMSCYTAKNKLGIALADLSTGEFKTTELPYSKDNFEAILNSNDPTEILITDSEKTITVENLPIQLIDSTSLKGNRSIESILEFYNVKNLDSLGLESLSVGVIACSMLVQYIVETQRMEPDHMSRPKIFSTQGSMILDRATIRNLDLVANSYSGGIRDSLVGVLDETKTRMGKRMLYSWILNPLLDLDTLEGRLDTVDAFYSDFELLSETRELLSNISDVDRIVGKIGLNRANARDLNALSESLHKMEIVLDCISKNESIQKSCSLESLFKSDDDNPLGSVKKVIEMSIHQEPPTTITEGGIIKDGFNAEVDELRNISGNSKSWVDEFINSEKERTGISSMKIGFNKVFGYYIEVTKAHSEKVPDDYVRKQTLVNAERYITEELKKKEEIILGAEGKLGEIEYKIFQDIREKCIPFLENIKKAGSEIARLDILSNFAHIARNHMYVRPLLRELGDSAGVLKIESGRHPVVERISADEFVSNDTFLASDTERMCIITGPNMSGKSTFIRQVALITILAQIGSFVPADSAEITLTDRIFSRVGAADNLSQGRSTFMVEMEEAANIINNATENSLVILDEVGRGTSTYDGVSIAWSLSEYLISVIKAKTLFATHYHELLELAKEHPGLVKNYNVHVKENESGDEVIFLRKIVEGGTDRSYGIYVATLAGVPDEVTKRANEILTNLRSERDIAIHDRNPQELIKGQDESLQFSFFDEKESVLLERLKNIDINNLTPVEALQILSELKQESESRTI